MKSIQQHINERLQLNRDRVQQYEYFPKNRRELVDIILDITEKNKNNKVIDLNCIDTSEITNMSGLFEDSPYVYDVSKWNVSNCEDFSQMFSNCKNIKNLDLSTWKLSTTCNHIEMFGMFNGCENLETVEGLDNWNTKKVSRISRMFSGCHNLKEIYINTWDTSRMTQCEAVFSECENLKTIGDISRWDTANVFWMGEMFYKCKSLKSIGDISNWKFTRFTDISYMFYECSSLTGLGDLNKWNIDKDKTAVTRMFAKTKIQKPDWY
jgi:surface protein